MKAMLSLCFILFFTTLSSFGFADGSLSLAEEKTDAVWDFCYKPSKPLILASSDYKKRYAEDIKEYQRCRQSFLDMQARVASMKEESEKNAKKIIERFAAGQFN